MTEASLFPHKTRFVASFEQFILIFDIKYKKNIFICAVYEFTE